MSIEQEPAIFRRFLFCMFFKYSNIHPKERFPFLFYKYAEILYTKKEDAFIPTSNATEDDALECRATLLNINYGHNRALLDTCRRLHDYSYFIAKVNEYADSGLSMEEAVDNANWMRYLRNRRYLRFISKINE